MFVFLLCALVFSVDAQNLSHFAIRNFGHHVKTLDSRFEMSACASAKKRDFKTCEVHSCHDDTVPKKAREPKNYPLHEFVREDPKLKCKEETSITLHWKDHHHFAYFLEAYTGSTLSDSYVTIPPVTVCTHYRIHNLTEDTEYEMALWGFSYKKQAYFRSNDMKYRTFPKNHTPALVTGLRITEKMVYSHDTYTAVVEWDPNDSCYFHIVWFEDSYVKDTRVAVHTTRHEIKLTGLGVDSQVTFQIRAMESKNSKKTGNETLFRFTTPSCIETYRSLEKCVPAVPRNVTVSMSQPYLSNTLHVLIYDIALSWIKPDLIPDMYMIELSNSIDSSENLTHPMTKSLNVSGDKTAATIPEFVPGVLFSYSISACSAKGCSLSADGVKHRPEFSNLHINPITSNWSLHIWLIVAGVVVLVSCSIASFFIYRFYRNKPHFIRRRRRPHRYGTSSGAFGDLELERTNLTAAQESIELKECSIDCIDTLEVDPEGVTVESVIGEGAFGVVRKARIKMPDGEMQQVAIKMLKASTTSEEIRQFIKEIEIMKSVKQHPNIVSFIGCIRTNSLDGPMLIVEYCSRGDLQSYLRNAWERFCSVSKEVMCSEENDKNSSQFFANKTYDFFNLHLGDDFIIQPKHLLSIARQVALGMEHLAKTHVVHRDLAARNVLVCDNHSVKVSDFGLSRDVYQDNVYCKNGGGRLPIRWMAIESLTHQRYTTQSDVWSFGILLWEIVTLGGTPYVGMQTFDLLDFLTSGQRLSCPGTCSPDLYSIMRSCWLANPNSRPTFTDLHKSLDKLLENVSQYLNLENIEIPFNFDDAKLGKQAVICDSDMKPNIEVS